LGVLGVLREERFEVGPKIQLERCGTEMEGND